MSIGLSSDFDLLGHPFHPIEKNWARPAETEEDIQEREIHHSLRDFWKTPGAIPTSDVPIGQFISFSAHVPFTLGLPTLDVEDMDVDPDCDPDQDRDQNQ